MWNADYAAVRHLGSALPDVDPHAIEEWSFWGFLRFGWQQGARSFGRLMLGYTRFIGALVDARTLHRSHKRAIAGGARIASGSRASRRRAASRSTARPRSIASRARRSP